MIDQDRVGQFEEMFPRVEAILGHDKAVLWFTTENPMLGEVRPIDMINAGRGWRLAEFITAAENANASADVGQKHICTPDVWNDATDTWHCGECTKALPSADVGQETDDA